MDLVSLLRKLKTSERENFKVVILGLSGAGKTCLLKRYSNVDISDVKPTLGFNIRNLDLEVTLNVWDLGGSSDIIQYWPNHFFSTAGLIWIVDSADSMNICESKNRLFEVLSVPSLATIPLVILCNKQDLESALPVSQIKELLNLASINSRKWVIFNCSALENRGFQEGINWLANFFNRNN